MGEFLGAVQSCGSLIDDLISKASQIKPDSNIEPPLSESDFGSQLSKLNTEAEGGVSSASQYALVETVLRERFYDLVNSISIDQPEFIQVWNLLDIVSILSDNEQCEPGLIFWLIEELLDSQTIQGCRKVFDYLESRRERNIAKHFKEKNLIILRCCNELLRRLSRAEDTVFCGRVFVFLFQSFPLGDKSSVNLRGLFHVENVTIYDELDSIKAQRGMNIDASNSENSAPRSSILAEPLQNQAVVEHAQHMEISQSSTVNSKEIPILHSPAKGTSSESQDSMDMDILYPVFWSLQHDFSAPTRLFVKENFSAFQKGLEFTLSTFQKVKQDSNHRNRAVTESSRRVHKRKRSIGDDQTFHNFNPKYLTSRDLFELEIRDVSFQRHILVQCLIILEFILSLTTHAKARYLDINDKNKNKSVLYSYNLNDEDAKWATNARANIATYLQSGTEGKFYYRMVDTVLSRDKNWAWWKADSCQPFQRNPISIEDYKTTQVTLQRVCTSKKLRSAPLGSVNFTFLSQEKTQGSLERLKEMERYSTPDLPSFKASIDDIEFDISVAQDDDEKASAESKKTSRLWRTLRTASRTKLSQFDKIEDGKNWQALFLMSGTESRKASDNQETSSDEVREDVPELPGSRTETSQENGDGVGAESHD